MPLGLLQLILFFFLVTVYSSPLPIASDAQLSDLGASDALDSLLKRATSKVTTRIKSTTDTQSVNWIEDVSTVDSSLNIALALPIPTGPALAFAQDEPENVKLLKATPGIDAVGTSAGTTLKKVFGGVLDQLGSIVSQPLNLPVAVNAVARIIVNRCKNVLPAAEKMWKSTAVAMKISTACWPRKANQETAYPGKN